MTDQSGLRAIGIALSAITAFVTVAAVMTTTMYIGAL